MKGYKKGSGWLIKCQNGPMDNQFIRAYNVIKRNGEWVETDLDWEWGVVDNNEGRYILEPLNLATGKRAKAKHKGVEQDAYKYVWRENETTVSQKTGQRENVPARR